MLNMHRKQNIEQENLMFKHPYCLFFHLTGNSEGSGSTKVESTDLVVSEWMCRFFSAFLETAGMQNQL